MLNIWIAVYWSSAVLLAYVLIGYPLLLLLAAALRGRRWHREVEPAVTLVIPMHNEESVAEAKLQNALDVDYPREKLEILVASDGSADRTIDIARSFEARGVQVLDFPMRRGKASVINDAAVQASGEVLCFCDANVMFEPNALRTLVRCLSHPKVGAATADVRLGSHQSNFGKGESFYYRVERCLQRGESKVGSLMGVDGGMYVVRKDLFQPLPPDTILDDFVITMSVIRQGYRVVYEPRAVAHENGTPAAKDEWRRRVRIAAGAVQSMKRGQRPPVSRPVELWQYLSHKALRWFAPLWLFILLVSNVALAGAALVYQATLVAQLAICLAAAMGMFSIRFRATRLGGIAFYFIMSNAAVAVGLMKGVVNRQPVTWHQAGRMQTATSHQELSRSQ